MNYRVNGLCPDDWSLAQKLILRGREPLPGRRCFAKAIPKVGLYSFPISRWKNVSDKVLSWSGLGCKNLECLNGKELSKDRVGCFDSANGCENKRYVKARGKNDFLIDDVLALGSGGIRIGLVVLPATMNLRARIWAVSCAHVVQVTLCCVSSVGISVNLCGSPELRRDCWRGRHIARVIPELGVPNVRGAAWLLRLRLVPIGAIVGMPPGMTLNQAQMLIRVSEALAQFRVDHRIPDDVVIERPGPNDDADWVEGEGNWMPNRTWFIYQAGLRFPLSKLLRTVLSICGLTFMQISVNFVQTVLVVEALMQREGLEFTAEDLFHVYCVVKPRKNFEAQMLEGNHYLRLRKPNQPQMRLVTDFPDKDQYLNDFIWVSGQWEFPTDKPDPFSVPRHRGYVPIAAISFVNNCGRSRKVSDLLGYVPLYRYTIPLRAARQGRPILPPLQIRRPSSRPRSSLSDEVSDLFEGTSVKLQRLLEEVEGESSGSSESSSSSWDVYLRDKGLNDEAEVEDGEEVDQVLAAVPLVPAPLVPIPEPINLPSSDFDIAIIEPREIVEHYYSHSGSSSSESQGNEEIMAPKVTSADTSKDHETCVALGNAVMLPQDVVDHAAETTAEFEGKLVMLGAQAFACGEVYKKLFDRAFERAGDVYEKQLAELRPGIFQEGWLACLKELKIPPDHPAWSSPAPPVQLLAFPERYSPINLPDFNEEEYATLPADEGNIITAILNSHSLCISIRLLLPFLMCFDLGLGLYFLLRTIFLESLHNADSNSARFISPLHILARDLRWIRHMSDLRKARLTPSRDLIELTCKKYWTSSELGKTRLAFPSVFTKYYLIKANEGSLVLRKARLNHSHDLIELTCKKYQTSSKLGKARLAFPSVFTKYYLIKANEGSSDLRKARLTPSRDLIELTCKKYWTSSEHGKARLAFPSVFTKYYLIKANEGSSVLRKAWLTPSRDLIELTCKKYWTSSELGKARLAFPSVFTKHYWIKANEGSSVLRKARLTPSRDLIELTCKKYRTSSELGKARLAFPSVFTKYY
ncbi:S-adenosyl-L-methionine-dependent methyltransferases superfamily protein [Actinidia rufa]|uniref:S-adenosyl-L-methionine-dependent methyltransferases superfamily protein n=1 Tax=Actinidia rufa TaxID=165716 RepID=A0A7J0F2D7_9ERIC|nr:S-adenosyl-L-methionine-dependent methyltransferases superfamily protein [Actinidia rufa]